VVGAPSPLGKVLSMLSDLQAKIKAEGAAAQADYAAFTEWCEDRSRTLAFEIQTTQTEIERSSAAIAEQSSTLSTLSSKRDELVAAIASGEKDLKAATAIRAKESADFAAEESELSETIDIIERAISILEHQSGGASMAQLSNVGSFTQALDTMVRASIIRTGDASRLAAFVQDSGGDEDDALGAPAGTVYTSHSGDLIDTLQDLLEKAQSQLAETRRKEEAARHAYEMLKQSLTDEIAQATQDLEEAKKGEAETTQKQSSTKSDVSSSKKALAVAVGGKESLHQDCVAKAESFEAESKSRAEELQALADAKKAIEEVVAGTSFDQVSFVQRSMLASGTDLHRYEAVRLVRDLAHKHHSAALTQLASQMAVAVHSSDAFAKVKGLISDMIARLEKEAGADATKKAFCDKELAESNAKKSDKDAEVAKLGTKIEQLSAQSARLKAEVAALENELSKLAKSQAELDKLRADMKATFEESKAELETGIAGVKTALKILTEYYSQGGKAHVASEGAAGGIISLLEVVEADFSKNLAQITADEEAAVAAYERTSKENEVDKTSKEQDVAYKNKESKQLDKTSSELTSDQSGVQAELDAVQEYLTKIEGQCVAKAETYGARASARDAEIAGLKQALEILNSETALVQRRTARRTLRGGRLSAVA